MVDNLHNHSYFTNVSADGNTMGCVESYRGFQGQESEKEITGSTGSHSFFKYRISDNRLGRFFAVDPLASKYPWNSPYAFSENKVIQFIELEGAETYATQFMNPSYREGYAKSINDIVTSTKIEASVLMVFGEVGGVAGLGEGAGMFRQGGTAYDKGGKTLYSITGSFAFENHKTWEEGSDNPEFVAGGDIDLLEFGVTWDSDSKSFEEAMSKTSITTFSGGIVDVGIGENQYSVAGGLSYGIAIKKMNIDKIKSLSMDKSEFDKLKTGSWSVTNQKAITNSDGKITGYTGTLSYTIKTSSRGDGDKKTISTDITVTSGATYDNDGNASSNQMWKSNKYKENLSK